MPAFYVHLELIKRWEYCSLWEALGRLAAHQAMDALWLVEGDFTVAALHDHLSSHIDAGDGLWVSCIRDVPQIQGARVGTNDWLRRSGSLPKRRLAPPPPHCQTPAPSSAHVRNREDG